MTPRRRPRPRAPAPPARAAREARRWRCTERVVGASARGRGGAGRTFRRAAGMAAQGLGPGPGSAAPPGLEAARQKLALRRKKVLSTEELELYELAQAAGGGIDPDVFKILVDLLKLNVAPLAVFQMLKSMCAGQRLASEPQDPAAVSLPTSSVPETREASFLSARNSSPPARPSFSSSPQPAASPVLLRSPAATHSPLSPGPPGSLRLSCCLFSPFAETWCGSL
nr:mitotic-spindle organizing protein 2B-like isoform X9 [Pan paniscus]